MQTQVEMDVKFWDRLVSLNRTKECGEIVPRGSVGGLNIVRIHKGQSGDFVTVKCIMQDVLVANILQWPSAVSEDGCSLTLWLFDFSLGRDGSAKRQFDLTFFQSSSCKKFFDSYTQCLKGMDGPSYDMLKDGGKDEEDGSDKEDEAEDIVESTAGLALGGGQEDKDEDDGCPPLCDKNEEEDEENEKRRMILELEENFGESQNLFAPQYPDNW